MAKTSTTLYMKWRFTALLLVVPVVANADVSTARGHLTSNASDCFGDCDLDGQVTIGEAVLLVGIALRQTPSSRCSSLVEAPPLSDLIRAVRNSVVGCGPRITYTLTDASELVLSPPVGPPSGPQPLLGSFTVVNTDLPREPNVLFAFSIVDVNMHADAAFSITGGEMSSGCGASKGFGCIKALTIDFPNHLVPFSASLSVNDERIWVDGGGVVQGNVTPPSIADFVICGTPPPHRPVACEDIRQGVEPGYVLRISANPRVE